MSFHNHSMEFNEFTIQKVLMMGLIALFGHRVVLCCTDSKAAEALVRFKVRMLGAALGLYAVGIWALVNYGYTMIEAVIFSVLLSLLPMVLIRKPKQHRRIPKRIRQTVIDRDLRGQQFDPSKHHLDHIVPYSKGGDHSVENLRVLSKSENLARGNRMPGLRDLVRKSRPILDEGDGEDEGMEPRRKVGLLLIAILFLWFAWDCSITPEPHSRLAGSGCAQQVLASLSAREHPHQWMVFQTT